MAQHNYIITSAAGGKTVRVDPTDAVAAHLEKRLTNLPPDSGIGFVMDAHGPAELRKIAAELIQLVTTGRIDG